jgi:hypothetical protein
MNGEPPLKINFDRIFNPQMGRKDESRNDDIEKQGSYQDGGSSQRKSAQHSKANVVKTQEVETL